MLINLSTIIKKYNIKPTGVLHIGSNAGQEAKAYADNGIPKVIWIDCCKEVIPYLKQNLKRFTNQAFIEACIGDVDGKEVTFNVSNNEAQSSSVLELDYHKTAHPEVKYIASYTLKTVRIDTLFAHNKIDIAQYDFVNVDLQGYDYQALVGMGDLLHKVNYLYIEVNKKPLYKDCVLVDEVTAYIEKFGFEVKQIEWCGDFGWGDLFAIRTPTPYSTPTE